MQGFIALVGFQAKPTQFLAAFDGLIAVTVRPCAYISRSGHFLADKPIVLPLAHARGVISLDASITETKSTAQYSFKLKLQIVKFVYACAR
jgi:hypothetical protein